tara:strand:- start:114 stop:707 length:594 start_codon:yes stop_codon:yes gene_type:complete
MVAQETQNKQSKFAKNYENKGIDPFSRAPAGYSLTQTPNKWPWEKPPQHADFTDAFVDIRKRLAQPEIRLDLLRLIDAGIPVETITRTITFSAFIKGIVSPDLAELLNLPISMHLTLDARRAGISPKFNNNVIDDSIPQHKIFDIMKELNPERYKQYEQGTAFEDSEDTPSKEKEKQPSVAKQGFLADIVQEKENGN